MSEMWYTYWLACVEGITGGRKCELCRKNGSAEAVYYIEEKGIREQTITEKEWEILKESKKKRNWREAYQKAVDRGIQMAVRGQKNYPKRLEELAGMPYALFFIGEMPQEGIPSVAVVGARRCSSYGEKMTLRFVERLAESGIQIISGMALGIDGAAHRAAMKAGGKTVAVLGSGINVPYPRENYDIYHDIRNGGGVVLSECGLDIRPDAFRFPYRNRIISGLSSGVLVVEAREKSGSLITADQALEQGREVYAVPGRITDSGSRGCNGLIRMGAVCVTQVEDILDEMGINRAESKAFNKNLLAPAEKKVYSCVRLESRHIDDICFETGISVSEVTQILYELEQKRLIKQLVRNYYVRA